MNYSIGEFARLCGINATTLRAWQRRYGLLKPQRSDGGHRLYSDDDIQQALNILDWLKKGVPVSKVKTLLERPEEEYTNQWLSLQEQLLQQLTAGRIEAARNIIYDSGREYPREELVIQLLRPLRRRISANLATTITLREILDGLIIAYTSFSYFNLSDFKNAKYWAELQLKAENSEINTAPFIDLGMVCFELGDHEESYRYLDRAYQYGKARAFKERPKKYLDFYLAKKKSH